MALKEKAIVELREEFKQFYKQCKNHISTAEKCGYHNSIFYMVQIDLNHFYGYITALADLKIITYSDYDKFSYSARTLFQETIEECQKYNHC